MQVDHEYMGQCLQDLGVDSGASGAHGLLSGLFCGGEIKPQDRLMHEWFSSASPDPAAMQACKAALDELALAIQASVDGTDFGFPLLLPDEDSPLSLRATAVRDWCEGFLYGIGLVNSAGNSKIPAQVQEALQDMSEISRMDIDNLAGDEEEEVALTEVTEYIWVAAMLVHDELVVDRQDK